VTLRVARTLGRLPEARSGIAASPFGSSIFVAGGLSAAGTSTDTVFRIDPAGTALTAGSMPSPIHDAAAAQVTGRLLVFGGGQTEGSDRIVQVLPPPARLIGALPQPLSDLDAVTVGSVTYVLGGWNGSVPNPDIYAVQPTGVASTVGTLPFGVRYPGAAALGGRVIIAGGETAASTPTSDAWSFDTSTHKLTRLPNLPVPTDHTTAAVLNGRFYLIGGLRQGVFTNAIISWAPGESSWRSAGHLPAPVSDLAAVPFDGGIVAVGGRGSAGQVSTVILLRAG
jgi:N-acetylneuraminic acid mutarotase